jgi:transcriptional regulator with GAF, ATPase, and Fis domain
MRESNLQLEQLSVENEQKNWLLSGATTVNEAMRGEQEIEELSINIITRISNYINAPIGAFFLINSAKKTFKFTGGYAYQPKKGETNQYHLGEGLVGQVAAEKQVKLLNNIPLDYLKISSGLGNTLPKCIYLIPIVFEDETLAVIELGLQENPDEENDLIPEQHQRKYWRCSKQCRGESKTQGTVRTNPATSRRAGEPAGRTTDHQ